VTPRGPLLAVSLLTIVPVPRVPFAAALPLGGAAASFPLVGLVVGGAVAIVDALLLGVLPVGVVSALDLALLAIVTSGLHLDGLADTADGLAAMGDRTSRVAALRDSRVGAIGGAALALLIVLQWSALAALHIDRGAAIVVAAVLARWAMAIGVRDGRDPSASGLAAFVANATSRTDLVIGSVLAGLVAGAIAPAPIQMIGASVLVAVVVTTLARARLGVVNGDVCGAIGELSFAAVLVVGVAR